MPLPQRIDAVFFDVGGPFYPDVSYVEAVLTALDLMRGERGLGPTDRERFQEVYDDQRQRQCGSLRTQLATEFLDSGARAELHERTQQFWVHPSEALYTDVLPLLRQLHGVVRIGVLANQGRSAVDAMIRDGVAPFIDVWGISAIVGYEKPSPDIFNWALGQAGTDAVHAVHVGNRLDNDVRAAHAVGLGTVWLLRGEAPDDPTPEQRAQADLVVSDLTGLGEILLGGSAAR